MAPKQKPGKSRQDYQTPPEFLEAVKARLGVGEFVCDLAASESTTVADEWFDEEIDSLKQVWCFAGGGWAWLNPPFARIEPWVRKAFKQSREGQRIAVLVPAGVGANWWRDWVHQKAFVLLLNGRLKFVGEKDFYPKDCVLLLYGPDIAPGYDVWQWPKQAEAKAAA